MEGARARLIGLLWATALGLSAGRVSVAQAVPATGALAGKLTDLHSAPLAGVTVVVRNAATGAEARTTTAKNGLYRFDRLDAGEYTIEAESAQLGRSELDGIVVDAGHEARVQAAMEFEPAPVTAVNLRETPVKTPVTSSRFIADPKPAVTEQATRPRQANIPPALASTRDLPTTVMPAPEPPLAAEPLRNSRLTSQPMHAPQTPKVEQPTLSATIKTKPLQQFPPNELNVKISAGSALRSIAVASIDAPLLAMSVGAARGLEAAIKLEQLSAVATAAQQMETTTPAVTTTLSGEELQALPASGRHWQDFEIDAPATSAAAGSSQASLRGAGQDAADTTIDGATTRLAFGGAAGSEPNSQDEDSTRQEGPGENGSREGWPGGRGVALSEVAVREVRTEAGNVEAEGAHAAGGRMNVETQSGANEMHGQGFYFDRQNNWGARNPFTQWVENTGTAAAPVFTGVPFTPPDHEMTWGVGLGGRIRRGKTERGETARGDAGNEGGLFWFGALDSYQRNDPGLATVKNAGDFFTTYEPTSPEIVQLSARLGENSNQAYNDYLGAPGSSYAGAGLEQLDNLLGPAPRAAAQWVGFARLDWQATERQRFTLEGVGAIWNSPGGGLTRVSEAFGSHSFGSSEASQKWLLGRWEVFITPNLLAVTQASAGREILIAHADTPSTLEQSFLSANAWGQLPQITVDSRYGLTIGNPSRFGQGSYPDERLYHGQEMVNWVRHGVLVKAGVELDHNSDATSLLRNQTGTYYYSKVQNFISDALSFEKFGIADLFNYQNPHNCNPAGTALGALPCYSYYSQTMGPTNWNLSTNDWAGFATAQWQPAKRFVLSAGLRWEREQMPPPLTTLLNTALPLTETLPAPGNQWGPRFGLALGSGKSKWPVLRLGYGMYFGRTENATIETALTQTGSFKGDLNFFLRPTDGLNPITLTGDAPPFPYVLSGEPANVVAPGAVEFAAKFHNPEVDQGLASIEENLPGHLMVTAAALVSLGRRLPISIDTNIDPAVNPGSITYAVVDKTGTGPIKAAQIKVPYYALWPSGDCPSGSSLTIAGQCGRLNPSYQQVSQIMSRANSTYEAAMIKVTRYTRRGLSLHAHYTYSHAMDWNPNESTVVAGSDVLDPADFSEEYGTSNLDVRHSAAAMLIFEAPWKLRGNVGHIGNGWMLSGTGQFHTGLPYSMRTTGSIPEEFSASGSPTIIGMGPGMNGSGGDNLVYGVGRNTFRYPQAWKADVRIGKTIKLSEMRQLELLAESFNLFNHQNVTEIETTGYEIENSSTTSMPTLNYLTAGTTGTAATTASFGTPLNINATNFYRERQIQFGVRLRF